MKSKELHILILEPSGRRGLCHYTHNLANALVGENIRVLVATSINFETKPFPRKHEVIELFNRFYFYPYRWASFLFKLRKFRPEVIHIQGAIHPLMYLALWKLLKVWLPASKFVYTAHEIFPKKMKRCHLAVLRRLYQGIPSLVVHAKQKKDLLIEHFQITAEKISIHSVGNNMALLDYLQPEEETTIPSSKNKILLFFGIIEPHKGLMTLIKSIPAIKKAIPNILLIVAGEPFEDMKKYHDEINRLHLEDAIKLKLDYISFQELPPIFKIADLVVLPYTRASQSGVLLSAFHFRKPVIVTSVGGLPELVENGKTGLIIPPDNPEALAEAAIQLLQNDLLRQEMGERAFDTVQEKHSWDSIAQKTRIIYQKVSDRQGKRSG